MKGIIIWEDNERATYCELINNAYPELTQYAPKSIICSLKGEALESSKATCSKDDTYDFETGALIALMKMCGREKALKAVEELYFLKEPRGADLDGDVLESKVEYMAKEIKRLKEKNAELLGAKGALNYIKSCNESTIESLENTRDLLINKNNELIEESKRLKAEKDLSWKNYQRNIQKKQDRINELEAQITASEDDKQKTIEYYEKEIKRLNNVSIASLKEKIEKLKLDCEKLQHGYVDTDMIFCGGRQNGKQYAALVELFKKIDQKKVDEAYKEAYNTTLPAWQKEALRQAYEIRKESKEKPDLPRTLDINGTVYRKSIQIKDFGEEITKLTVDSLIGQSWDFRQKCVDEWIKPPTKREEMWGEILELHKTNDVIIEVKKEDVTTFLHEIENRIPEITWGSGVKIFETKYTIKDVYFELKSHDVIYFRLSRATKLTYTSDPHIYPYRELKIIDYLPPMRWDLFEKGRLAVKVDYDNYKEFYEACEKELGKKPSAMYTGDFTISICKKDGLFQVFTVGHQKTTGKKIVNWEDVR